MPPADDADRYDEADLDERLSRVFEERGWPTPAACRAEDRRAAPEQAPRPAEPAARTPVREAPVASPVASPVAAPAVAAKPAGEPDKKPSAAAPIPVTAPARRSGRREKTMLLGMLGTLAGAFAGVLSLKLFVPRPPSGTGPDVHLAAAPLDLVEPPELSAPPSAPPSLPDPFKSLGAPAGAATRDEPSGDAPLPSRRSAFAAAPLPADGATEPSDAALDPLPALDAAPAFGGLAPAEPPHLHPVPEETAPPGSRGFAQAPAASLPPAEEPAAPPGFRSAPRLPSAPGFAAAPLGAAGTVLPVAATSAGVEPGYVVRDGDSWWSIAEGAYGDGRLYKALFAWNRTVDPRTSLTPGTRLEVPHEARLRAAWGRLIPTGAP